MCDKGLLPKILKKNAENLNNNQIKKWAKDLNKHLAKDMKMVKKAYEKMLRTVQRQEMQCKTAM